MLLNKDLKEYQRHIIDKVLAIDDDIKKEYDDEISSYCKIIEVIEEDEDGWDQTVEKDQEPSFCASLIVFSDVIFSFLKEKKISLCKKMLLCFENIINDYEQNRPDVVDDIEICFLETLLNVVGHYPEYIEPLQKILPAKCYAHCLLNDTWWGSNTLQKDETHPAFDEIKEYHNKKALECIKSLEKWLVENPKPEARFEDDDSQEPEDKTYENNKNMLKRYKESLM